MEPVIVFELEREINAFGPEDQQEMFSSGDGDGDPENRTLTMTTDDWDNLGNPDMIEVRVNRR